MLTAFMIETKQEFRTCENQAVVDVGLGLDLSCGLVIREGYSRIYACGDGSSGLWKHK